jgi:HTH-type transcriptional regulator/antitoxin HipB
MDYPVRTLSQLRPILQGFRKAAGLTQAVMASRLGVTQQTYAQLEANPATVSVERLFRVLRALNVDLTLAHTVAPTSQSADAVDPIATIRAVKKAPASDARRAKQVAQPASQRTPSRAGKQATAPATQPRSRNTAKQTTGAKAAATHKSRSASAGKTTSVSKKTENW